VSNIFKEVIQQIKFGDKFVRVTELDQEPCKMRKELTINLCLHRTISLVTCQRVKLRKGKFISSKWFTFTKVDSDVVGSQPSE
jgi:hypothetical protein